MASDKRKNVRSRRRGVRASRVRLSEALAAAGIRTQAALAERIADLEGLDAVPRDVVYRVFRQQPVDLNTLTRVARALDVPVHTLLLSSGESAVESPEENEKPPIGESDESAGPARRRPWLMTAAVALVALGALVWLGIDDYSLPGDTLETTTEAPPLRDLTGLRIVVRPFEGDVGQLAEALRETLAPQARVASAGATAATDRQEDAGAVAERLNADVVLEGELATVGRHAGVRVFAWSNGSRRSIWTTSVRTQTLSGARRDDLAAAIVLALRRSLAPGSAPPDLPSASAQEAYLRGRYHLDRSRTELNVKRAITRFAAALRDEPDYARAHAGLCQALVQESLISSEPGTLQDAGEACARAHELAPELPVVRRARAVFDRRNGRNAEAQQILTGVLEQTPDDLDALIEMAENALAIYRREGDDEARAVAVDYAERASAAEPGFWKAPFTLARIHFFTGDVDAAIAAAEAAVAADANEHSVTNLGTFYFCRGDHDQALDLYLRAQEITPEASLGEGQMCVAYYFARDFELAVDACQAAIEADSAGGSPARHEMWGNLADAYRQAGQTENAADAYARATELAERSLLTQGHSPNMRAHLAYYYTALRALEPARVPDTIAGKLEGELADASGSATDPQALIRVASAWALLGRLEPARQAYLEGTVHCAGFGASPDLDPVRL